MCHYDHSDLHVDQKALMISMTEQLQQVNGKALKIKVTLTIGLFLANIAVVSSPSFAYKDWGKINLYLPESATNQEKRIAKIAASGNAAEALALTNKGIASDKRIAGLLLIRIKLSEALLQEDKIHADFNRLVTLPLDEQELNHAIDLADQLEEIENGIKLGQRYLKDYGTRLPQPVMLLSRMYIKLKQYDKAEKILFLILDYPGMRDFTYTDLTRLYVHWNKPEKLIATASKALKNRHWMTPKSIMILHTLRGHAYLETKKYKEALDDYNFLIAQASSLPEVYSLRAQAYAGLGQNKLAEADRQKQKQLDFTDK